jgi:hypothetical protein
MSALSEAELAELEAVKKRFHGYKRLLINFVGRGAMEDTKIDEIGKAEFGHRWAGVFAADEAKKLLQMKDRFAIVNTATSSGRGSHWLAVYMTKAGVGVVYDSFGRDPPRVIWRLSRAAMAEHVALQGTNPNQEQRGVSAVCGQISLAFLLCVRDVGVSAVAAAV